MLAQVTEGTPVDHTIKRCTDIRKFVSVRTVKTGAVKNGEYLGKSIRWYYGAGEEGEIVVAANGNTVPRSKGARPLLELPSTMPSDVDFDWYIREAQNMLVEVGYQ